MPIDEQAVPVAAQAWWKHNSDLRLRCGVLTCPPPTCIEPEERGFGRIGDPVLNDIWHQCDHVRPPIG